MSMCVLGRDNQTEVYLTRSAFSSDFSIVLLTTSQKLCHQPSRLPGTPKPPTSPLRLSTGRRRGGSALRRRYKSLLSCLSVDRKAEACWSYVSGEPPEFSHSIAAVLKGRRASRCFR